MAPVFTCRQMPRGQAPVGSASQDQAYAREQCGNRLVL